MRLAISGSSVFARGLFAGLALMVGLLVISPGAGAQAQTKEAALKNHTAYRTVQVDGLSIFYREAGPKDAPTILLLHGLPSSSRKHMRKDSWRRVSASSARVNAGWFKTPRIRRMSAIL